MLTDTIFTPLEFLRPLWLLGIIAVLLFSLLRYKSVIKSKKQGLIAPHLSENLVDAPSQSTQQRFAFPLLAMIACIALSGPSFRSIDMPVYQIEKAQVLVLDLSYSMYATDLQPNRLSQEKYKAIDLIKKWGEGEKALIAYAGDAFTIAPLTVDGNAIINHIPNLSPEIMPVTGSRADLALERAITLLKNAGYAQGHIVFFTDDIDPSISEKMVERLHGTPWIVSVLAIASEQGAPIKLSDGSLLKNKQNEIVVPKLITPPLRALSNATNGLYLKASNNNKDIEKLGNYFDLKDGAKSDRGQTGKNKLAKDDGYWLTFLLLPLLLLLFRKGLFYGLLLTLTIPLSSPDASASIWKNDQQNALQAYQQQDYATAAKLFADPASKGSALYKNKQYEQALTQFSKAVTEQPNNANVFYNQGNAYAQLQKFDQAIEAYQQALTITPDFNAAQENKKLIEALKQQQQQKDQQQKDQQQKDQQQKDQQQKDQQQKDQQQKDQQQKDQQQKSEQQKSEQQKSEQQKSEQQKSEQQKSEQQKSEQQKSEQQKSEQQKAEQQKAEQQKAKKQDKQALTASEEDPQVNQELQDLPNWLKNMPDDPSLLLRNKMILENQKRTQSQPVTQQQSNGDIW